MKSAFVMLAGRSNVGKSTLLNALVGTKVSIVTPKPQTTRLPVRGIIHHPQGQLVIVDTPGLFLGKKDVLSKKLNDAVKETLAGVDLIVYVMDPTREAGKEELEIQRLLRATSLPILAVINKSDLKKSERPHTEAMLQTNVGQRQTMEISALNQKTLKPLIDALIDLAPEGDLHYPDLQLTDVGHNQWLEELIREKAFLALEQELPYSIMVKLDDLQIRTDGSRYLEATIFTHEERYKGMLIGAKGQMLKKIGQAAREEIEAVTGMKCFLDLHVDVDPNWPQRFRHL